MKNTTIFFIISLLLLAILSGAYHFIFIPSWNIHMKQSDQTLVQKNIPSTQLQPSPSSQPTRSMSENILSRLSSRQKIMQLYIFTVTGNDKTSASSSAKVQWILAHNPGVVNIIIPVEKSDKASASAENIKQQIALVSPITPLFYTNSVFPNDFTPVAVKTGNGAMEALLSGNMFLLIKSDRTLPSVEKMTDDLVQLYETNPDLKFIVDKNVLRLLQQKVSH